MLATISTVQVRLDVDRGFFDRFFPLYKRYRPNEQRRESPTEATAAPSDHEEFRSSGLIDDVMVRQYRWNQTYTTDAHEQLVRSYSDTRAMDPAAREGLIADLEDVTEREFDGTVVRPLVIVLTMGRRRE